MPSVQRALRTSELTASVSLSTSYANGDYAIPNPSIGVLLALHLTGTITAGSVLTVELWDSTLDRQYMPATSVTMVAGNTAGVSTGTIAINIAAPVAAAMKIKAKLDSGTGTLSTASLLWEQ